MANTKVSTWPIQDIDKENEFIIRDIHDWSVFDSANHQTIVMTEGWVDGPAAAILRGGGNAKAVLKLLAASGVKEIAIYHLEEKIPQLEEVFISTVVSEANHLFEKTKIFWRHDSSLLKLVENIRKDYSMLLMGAPLAKSEIGPLYEKIKQVYQGNITIVRGPISDEEFAEGDEIFKWVRERTFEAADFSIPSVLRGYKKSLNIKIAAMLPALNEEGTIGQVIETALEVKNSGLIDEVILIDSASTDKTVATAKEYHIPVYQHHEIKPELGAYHGKGEAMFKSGFITEADVILWVDTDIENITPTFFYGLIGPLLAKPEIKFVKGYFARPVRVEAGGIELGGGRVTEILARPWINMFLPELAGFIQPLAGTVAIYRDLFLKMQIPTNYGVEIAMLIQAVERSGLWSTCQVNLGEVIHKSKDVAGLSEMSFQILQVLAKLRSDFGNTAGNTTLRQVFTSQGHFEIGIKKFQTFWRHYGLN